MAFHIFPPSFSPANCAARRSRSVLGISVRIVPAAVLESLKRTTSGAEPFGVAIAPEGLIVCSVEREAQFDHAMDVSVRNGCDTWDRLGMRGGLSV